MRRRIIGTGVTGGVLGALLGAGWMGAVIALGTTMCLVGAVCWVLADPGRSKRLALLLTTCRRE